MRAAIGLGLRTLLREWRAGDLAVMFLALAVAVAALSGVGFLVDRIDRAMQLQASEVLGADLRLQSPDVMDDGHASEARRRGLRSARIASTLSVVLNGDRTQLSNVHAVSDNYPLRGRVHVAWVPFGAQGIATGIPAPGEVWPDSRLMAALDATPGTLLTVGAVQLRVTRVLVSRPDQGSGFVDLAPSLLMNERDLAATQLILPGSRASYAALFAGEPASMAAFATWLRNHRRPTEQLRSIAEASPQVGNASQRAAKFLSLASLASVLLCAVAVAMTARRYVQRHLDLAALLKTLGAVQSQVLLVSLVQLTGIALVATAAGAAAGFLAQDWLLTVLRGMIAAELPVTRWQPLIMGLSAALLLLLGFALPSLVQLARVPAMRVLRRDMGPPRLRAMLAFGPAALVLAALVYWVTRDARMALWFALALAGITLLLTLAAWGLIAVIARWRGFAGVAWRHGAANIARRRAQSLVQMVSLGLGLSALLMLAIIRGDLIDDWRARIPRSAPNYFFVNIAPEEREDFRAMLGAEGGMLSRMLPMIRGRMVAINGVATADRRDLAGRSENFATREQNLTWSEEPGASNRMTAGHWFTTAERGKPLVSVATDFQESLQLKMGDRLTFDIAGEILEVKISSFRRVQWDSMEPNFFLMFAPGLLDGMAGTYMASAQFRPASPATIATLVRRFPGISIFDLDELLTQVRAIIDKAVLAVQSVFLFTLLAGVVVLLAAVQATRDERRYESAILRTLGASRRTVVTGVLAEFALIGMLAGVVAAAVASGGGYLLATRMLEIPWRPNPLLWASGALLGAVLVCLAGFFATRSALAQPPMSTLRHG
jgi:putative ABC transport system permease protein